MNPKMSAVLIPLSLGMTLSTTFLLWERQHLKQQLSEQRKAHLELADTIIKIFDLEEDLEQLRDASARDSLEIQRLEEEIQSFKKDVEAQQ